MVSVIINNYNYARYIHEAIESVLFQTYPDWELIIVDDGSSDNSLGIIEKYEKLYPEKIIAIKKENGGQASCFNVGFEASHGDIIAFLDSDDFWFPNKLERIVNFHKKYGFVAHEKHFSDGTRQLIHTEYNDSRQRLLKRYGYLHSYDITTSTISLKRDLAEKIFPIPEADFRICADHFVNFAATYFENVCYVHEKLSYYRIHGSNGFVTQSDEFKSQYAVQVLDFASIENLNESLRNKGIQELVPHRTYSMAEEMWKEIGEGFEIKQGVKYLLYGTGNDSYKFSKSVLDKGGIIVGYCDSNPLKIGNRHHGKEVWSPEKLHRKRDSFDLIIIASSLYYPEISEKLDALGFERGEDYIFTPFF